jgi:hypothetical protein
MKKALIIEINYKNSEVKYQTKPEVSVESIGKILTEKYLYSEINYLRECGTEKPTKSNIIRCINKLIQESSNCKEIWIHYCGHSTSRIDKTGNYMGAGILPFDGKQDNYITDNEIRDLLNQIKCKAYVIFDCCYSNYGFNLEYSLVLSDGKFLNTTNDTKKNLLEFENAQSDKVITSNSYNEVYALSSFIGPSKTGKDKESKQGQTNVLSRRLVEVLAGTEYTISVESLLPRLFKKLEGEGFYMNKIVWTSTVPIKAKENILTNCGNKQRLQIDYQIPDEVKREIEEHKRKKEEMVIKNNVTKANIVNKVDPSEFMIGNKANEYDPKGISQKLPPPPRKDSVTGNKTNQVPKNIKIDSPSKNSVPGPLILKLDDKLNSNLDVATARDNSLIPLNTNPDVTSISTQNIPINVNPDITSISTQNIPINVNSDITSISTQNIPINVNPDTQNISASTNFKNQTSNNTKVHIITNPAFTPSTNLKQHINSINTGIPSSVPPKTYSDSVSNTQFDSNSNPRSDAVVITQPDSNPNPRSDVVVITQPDSNSNPRSDVVVNRQSDSDASTNLIVPFSDNFNSPLIHPTFETKPKPKENKNITASNPTNVEKQKNLFADLKENRLASNKTSNKEKTLEPDKKVLEKILEMREIIRQFRPQETEPLTMKKESQVTFSNPNVNTNTERIIPVEDTNVKYIARPDENTNVSESISIESNDTPSLISRKPRKVITVRELKKMKNE